MAPEARFGKPVDYLSDLYSLGFILHFMLTKELPEYQENNFELKPLKIDDSYSQELV